MLRFIILLSLLVFHPVEAVQYREMSGMVFPSLSEAGAAVTTRRAEFSLPVIEGKARFEFTLDAPEKSRLLIMGERQAEIRILYNERLWDEKDLAVEKDILSLMEVGQELSLDALPAGHFKATLSNLKSARVSVMLDQPLTKYPLHAKLTPFVARMNDEIQVTAWFDEPDVFQAVKMRVHLGQRQWTMRRVGEHFQARIKINLSKEADAIQHLSVVAEAEDNDEAGAQRTLPLSFLLSQPITGFEGKIFVSETGGLNFKLKPAEGRFRVDVLYGFEGKAIAMARDYIFLDGKPVSSQIDRPDFAKAADKALIRLFNMKTLEVEDQALLDLPLDRVAQRGYQHKGIKPQELTEQEKEALKALEVQDRHPDANTHSGHSHLH